NHGDRALHEVYVGLCADLDARRRDERSGSFDDLVTTTSLSRSEDHAFSFTIQRARYTGQCSVDLTRPLVMVHDGAPGSTLPWFGGIPPAPPPAPLASSPAAFSARAPAEVSFHTSVFVNPGRTGRGLMPKLDSERLEALKGGWPQAPGNEPNDY